MLLANFLINQSINQKSVTKKPYSNLSIKEIKTTRFITNYLSKKTQSMTEKLQNPFLKPSPFSKQSLGNQPQTSYSKNIYESNVSSFQPSKFPSSTSSSAANNSMTSALPATNYNNYTQIKPTHDFEFSSKSSNDLQSLLDKNPFRKATLIDNSRNIGGNSYGDGHYDSSSFKIPSYDKYEPGQNNYYGLAYGDNQSDSGSAYTHINKIYQLDDQHRKYGGNPEKLSNPFARKNLVTESIAKDDFSDSNFRSYQPLSSNKPYKYEKVDYSSVPNTKINNHEFDAGQGSKDYGFYSHQHTYNYDYEKYSPGYVAPVQNIDSQSHLKDSYEPPSKFNNNYVSDYSSKVQPYSSKESYQKMNEQPVTYNDYQQQPRGYDKKHENQSYNYKVNQNQRNSEVEDYRHHEYEEQPVKNTYNVEPIRFLRDDYQDDEQDYREPAFGGGSEALGKMTDRESEHFDNRRTISESHEVVKQRWREDEDSSPYNNQIKTNKSGPPNILKFDADQSEEERRHASPQVHDYSSKRNIGSHKDIAVREDGRFPSMIEIKGMLYHKIDTA